MKFLKVSLLLIITALVLKPAKADPGLRYALTNVIRDYFEIEKALAANKPELVTEKSQGFIWNLKTVPVASMNSSQHTLWFDCLNKLMRESRGISQGGSINEQKQNFSALSIDFFEALKMLNASPVALYKFTCKDDGRYWLSKSITSKNPYGNKGCSKVEAMLKGH
jgi:hypothetical protein